MDCHCGKELTTFKESIQGRLLNNLWNATDVDLMKKLVRTVEPEEVEDLLEELDIRRRSIRGLTAIQRNAIRDKVADTVMRRASYDEAEARGFVCNQFERCILCPHGQELTALEIAGYALSGG